MPYLREEAHKSEGEVRGGKTSKGLDHIKIFLQYNIFMTLHKGEPQLALLIIKYKTDYITYVVYLLSQWTRGWHCCSPIIKSRVRISV